MSVDSVRSNGIGFGVAFTTMLELFGVLPTGQVVPRPTTPTIATKANKQEDGRGGRTVLDATELDNASLLLKPEMTGNAKV